MALTATRTGAGFASPGTLRRRAEDPTIFGYAGSPDMPTLNREVFKWVQGLDLSHALKHVRRDVANGFLVAEILAHYFPKDVNMHGFANATSSHYKRDNWDQVARFCAKQGIPLPQEWVNKTMAGVHGAGEALLEHLYETFTGKKVQRLVMPPGVEQDSSMMPPLGGGSASNDNMPAIRSSIPAGQSIEFGQVQTQPAALDALAVRRQLSTTQAQS